MNVFNRAIHLHFIDEKIRRRLALHFKTDHLATLTDTKAVSKKKGNTEQFNRVLVSWLALQQAVTRLRQSHPKIENHPVTPWNCDDAEVRRLWEDITRPENLAALWEWLYQSASGEAEIWATQALQECKLRSEEDGAR